MRRREVIGVFGAVAAGWPLVAARAQQKPMLVIGFLLSGFPESGTANLAAFHNGLRGTGFVDGQNVAIEYRWAQGRYDRLPDLAAELVGRSVDVIVASGGTPPVLAAQRATRTIPIVFANVGDPVGQGLVASLARPGGNLTGVSLLFADLTWKRVELLSELAPQARRIAVLVNPTNAINETTIGDIHGAARARGLEIYLLKAGSDPEIDAAFTAVAELRADAIFVGADPFFFNRRDRVAAVLSRHSVPAMYAWREFVILGGLISYGPNVTETYRMTGIYAGKILKGARPADLPVEQPTKFELVINLKTAKALGLTVPPAILARADEVIE